MQATKPIELHGKPVAGGKFPLICTPLVGTTYTQVMTELQAVLVKKPDVLEWRVDFFEDIGNTASVLALAQSIKQSAGDVPLLFTRRSIREGGQKIALSEEQVVMMYRAVCESRCVDMVDFEMSNDPTHIAQIREAAHAHEIKLILSFHNFAFTPTLEALSERFLQAQHLGADVAKVAVMPKDLNDVLTLLTATLQASQTLSIPLISMSMGPLGSLTRLFGCAFGSALTFAVGASSSAPGQVPIEDLHTVLAIVQRSMSSR
jgi:3-dehydroquinate dehydratase-1